MPRYGVIDIGSNSTHIDLFEIKKDLSDLDYLGCKTNLNKLGIYLSKDKIIPEKKIIEFINILKEFINFAIKNNVKEIKIFATSILREALNSNEILLQVKNQTGYEIDLISEEREIELAFNSAVSVYNLKDKNFVVIDIGGGSTEIIFSKKNKKIFAKSFKIGLSKIKEMFSINNFFKKEDVEKISKFLINFLDKELSDLNEADIIIGTSSIFKCLGFILFKDISHLYDLKNKIITINDLENIINDFLNNSVEIEADKQDIVFIGTIFVLELLKKIRLNNVLICPWSIRESYLVMSDKIVTGDESPV